MTPEGRLAIAQKTAESWKNPESRLKRIQGMRKKKTVKPIAVRRWRLINGEWVEV